MILQALLILGFSIFVLWLLDQMVKFFAPGYVSLDNKNRPLLETLVNFIKIFKFW